MKSYHTMLRLSATLALGSALALSATVSAGALGRVAHDRHHSASASDAPEARHYEGTVTGWTTGSATLQITTRSNVTYSFSLTALTAYAVGHTTATVGAISNGEAVSVTVTPTSTPGALSAARVDVKAPEARHYEGTVTGWTTGSATLTIANGRHTVSFTLLATTPATTYSMNGTSTTAASLASGEHVTVTTTSTPGSAPLTAASVDIKAPDSVHVRGLVSSITTTTLELQVGTYTDSFAVTSQTQFLRAGQSVSASSITAKTRVIATLGTTATNGMLPVLTLRVLPAND